MTETRKSFAPTYPDAAATWNSRFSKDEYIFGTEPNAYLRHHASLWKSGNRVLCVADGEGRNSVWLAEHGLRVDAFDISDVANVSANYLGKIHLRK